jgi:hypothetical protein
MSVEALKQAMLDKAAALPGGIVPEANETETQKGIVNLYKNPPGRAPGTLDALWGDRPAEGNDGYPDVYSTAVQREAQDGREHALERLFDSMGPSAKAEQKLMGQVLENASKGAPHSPVLQHGRLHPKTASDETLLDKVLRVVGYP